MKINDVFLRDPVDDIDLEGCGHPIIRPLEVQIGVLYQ